MNSWQALAQLLRALALLALLVLALPAAARAWGRRVPRGAGRELGLEESVSLGGNRLVCVVRVGDERLVLGVTDGGISVLDTLAGAGPGAAPAPPAGFREQLERLWPRRGRDGRE